MKSGRHASRVLRDNQFFVGWDNHRRTGTFFVDETRFAETCGQVTFVVYFKAQNAQFAQRQFTNHCGIFTDTTSEYNSVQTTIHQRSVGTDVFRQAVAVNVHCTFSVFFSRVVIFNIAANKLEFGSQVPDAKDALPVGLAVSLLQDRQGQIDLNIPVSGSLDDPEFSVGGIIVKVIVNLISKAVTAPFALIGSMFGGEDMDLNNLQFATGSARLDEKTIKALNIVAKAMQDRPGIKIQIIGMASEKEDGEGLKEQLLMRDMRYAIYRDTTSATNAKVLTAAQIDKAIKQLYTVFSRLSAKASRASRSGVNHWPL